MLGLTLYLTPEGMEDKHVLPIAYAGIRKRSVTNHWTEPTNNSC